MQRITKDHLRGLVAELDRLVPGPPYHIGYAYGQPRLERLTDTGGVQDISPRLPAGELYRWIHAYLAGIELGAKLGRENHDAVAVAR